MEQRDGRVSTRGLEPARRREREERGGEHPRADVGEAVADREGVAVVALVVVLGGALVALVVALVVLVCVIAMPVDERAVCASLVGDEEEMRRAADLDEEREQRERVGERSAPSMPRSCRLPHGREDGRSARRAQGRRYDVAAMCRNIRVLHAFEPPTTEEEIRAAALQYVRKVSGTTKPARDEEEAFARAVEAVAAATTTLLHSLKPRTVPRTREGEREKGRLRWAARAKRMA